jgi:phenylacetate-coenzyme A ligase PaaK-like adenylate-forming protein
MSATEKLFTISSAFDHNEETSRLFVEAMKEMIEFHQKNSKVYGGIVDLEDFDINSIQSEDDLWRVPHIIVEAFKERKLLSLPEEEIEITYTSSGTSGHMSQTNWDHTSHVRQDFMRSSTVESYGLAEYDKKANYLGFSYDPEIGGQKGAAHAHTMYMKFAPAREVFYAIHKGHDGNPVFKINECIDKLDEYEKTGLPLRITGFPAFSYETLRQLDQLGKTYNFPDNSVLFSGGGWKKYTGEKVSFAEYAALVHRILGISSDRIRDVYGMVEHGVPYITCEAGHFHVPIYSRVFPVDPTTFRRLPDGEVGLLKLLTPYIRSVPAISILSTDLGTTRSDCECGRPGKYIELHGRGGVKKYAGCGISASQILGQ